MTRFDVAVLSLRILALYFGYEVLVFLAQLVGLLTGNWTEPIPILPWSLPIAVMAAIAGVLFWKSPAIARGLFPKDEPMSTASRPEIGALALKVVGLMLFAHALSRTGSWIGIVGPTDWIRIASDAATAAIGAACFLGATRIARGLFGARGTPMAQPLLAHLQAVTFSVLGLWLVATSLSSVAEFVRERIQIGEWGRGSWSQLALAVLGLSLLVGGRGLSACWYWLRHAGLNTRPERPA